MSTVVGCVIYICFELSGKGKSGILGARQAGIAALFAIEAAKESTIPGAQYYLTQRRQSKAGRMQKHWRGRTLKTYAVPTCKVLLEDYKETPLRRDCPTSWPRLDNFV